MLSQGITFFFWEESQGELLTRGEENFDFKKINNLLFLLKKILCLLYFSITVLNILFPLYSSLILQRTYIYVIIIVFIYKTKMLL